MHRPHVKDLEFLRRQHQQAKKRVSFAGKRIGIYSGTFNPVHAGHIAFALQALVESRLDQVVFLPERQPRGKTGVEHFGHRVAMLNKAIRPHPSLAILELTERTFTISRTLPRLRQIFPGATLVFLLGSDTALTVPAWPQAERLLKTSELVVGIRSQHQQAHMQQSVAAWKVQPSQLTIIQSFAPDISSHQIREALRRGAHAKGLLESVRSYARREWLYVSPANIEVVN